MKRLLSICFCYIIIFKVTLYSDLFQSNYTYHSNSLHLFSNPSILTFQQGIPVSAVFFIPTYQNRFEGAAAVNFLLDKNAFAIGYERGETVNNRIISGFSFIKEIFSVGSSFSFLFDNIKEPDLLIDAACTFKLPQSRYISLIFNNIISTGKDQNEINPKGGISFFGDFPGIKKAALGFDLGYYCNMYDLRKTKIDHGGKLCITGSFLKTPMLFYSAGANLYRDKYGKTNQDLIATLGFQLRINEASASLSYGVEYKKIDSDYKMHISIDYNPTAFRHSLRPSLDLKIVDGNGIVPGVYVSFDCSKLNMYSGIKNWVLVFCTLPSNNGEIIKSFSGGNMPPSTVYWDYRDVAGKYYDREIVYVRAILTDNNSNLAVTPWIKHNSQNRINEE